MSALVVMDSWLVLDGQVEGLELHLERFAASCRELVGAAPPGDFLRRVRSACAEASGECFPLVTGRDSGFDLAMRPAPQRRATTRLWVPPEPDPRAYPEHKGPDMPALLALRERARAEGADDAVLHREGTVEEAATATLLFARGNSLLVPPGPRLPSVTERLFVARWEGPVREESVMVEEAPGLRCWAMNSLHGVTAVRGWA
ncbi:aminotransferase class IV [Corynebacterium lowii]|uniref:Branched-chain-amino-acid aminotransferase n=1 Tax=Corynebacterium lowii TaxID=1544413 RepID=A0A0Q0TY56_9CORY|nr:aminotransferase class IV [Corynebacterium lowii]KQB83998.1 hypothetical protein Clow_02199 [Corynebacterium lowii]MDP9852752.1 branched-subunit amino acid aminotransferase/4-amino-4-deoxychorismate lyase [Corynebacterium lowii]